MAVFLVNNCTFQGCGLTFSTLGDLIQHIEETHIDTDPRSLEQQEEDKPTSLPLSYIMRFYTEADKREQYDIQKKQRMRAHSPAVSLPESTPTESEVDDESIKSDNDDSDDSWTTQEDFPSDVILNMMGGRERDTEGERPYGCPVPGCTKRYKNINGIKYHARHGHKNEASKVKKSYRCFCGKSYRSVQGLRNHTSQQHPSTEFTAPTPPPVPMATSLMSPPASHSINASSLSSTHSILGVKDSTDHQILHTSSLPLSSRIASLTSSSRFLPSKIAAQVKAVALATSKSQGQGQTTLALPLGTPVQFITQPASAVPVPVALKSLKQ